MTRGPADRLAFPIVLVVPYDLHKVSPNMRLHWRALAGRKKALKKATFYAWRMAGSPRVEVPIRLSVVVRRFRRLDDDNIIGGFKSCRDQLADCLGLPNDSPDYVSVGSVRQECKKLWQRNEHVEVWIEPREEERCTDEPAVPR